MSTPIDVVFAGEPAKGLEFVEVENAAGQSIRAGKWVLRADGRWVLRLEIGPAKKEVLDIIERALYCVQHNDTESAENWLESLKEKFS
jgi:hypothetical protein